MRLFDSHVHLDLIGGEDILRMAWGGVEAAMVPSPHLLKGLFEPESLFELWDKTLDYIVKYVASMGIEVYAGIAVPFYGIAAEKWEVCLKKMPEYLKEDRVVCVGEIGLDVANDHEKWLMREQIAIAKDAGLPLIVHGPTPREPQVVDVTDEIIKVLKDEKFPLDKVVLDHTGKNTLQKRLRSGCVTGLSICYDKLTAEEAAEIVEQNPAERNNIIIGSELGYGGAGHLSVVKAAWAMKHDGMPVSEIERVTWENPRRLFGLAVA
ncbi:MAG: TatD family hydrolase [Actinobacteria bacterium]|nr:TatD family hydrolase [Actinomycetota bacterium]